MSPGRELAGVARSCVGPLLWAGVIAGCAGGPTLSGAPAQAGWRDTVHVASPTGERAVDRASIVAAVERVRPGGTILFAPGTYLVGDLVPIGTPAITLLGHPAGTVLRGCNLATYERMERELAEASDLGPRGAWSHLAQCGTMQLTGGRITVRELTLEYTRLGLVLGCCENEGVLRSTEGGYRIEGNTFRNSGNSIRPLLSSPEPTVIRGNRFINTFHALSGYVRRVHIVDNDISVPEPRSVPGAGQPGFAIGIRPPLPTPEGNERTGADVRGENMIAGNRLHGHPDGIVIRVGSEGNDVLANTFDEVEGAAVVLEGDYNLVVQGAAHRVVDTGEGNRVVMVREGFQKPTGEDVLLADSILAVTRDLADAWTRLDPDDYLGRFSPDLVFYFEGQAVSRPEFEAVVRQSMASLRSSTFEVLDPEVEVLGPDAAVVSFGLREEMVDRSGAVTDLHAALTLVFERRGGEWLIVRAHESLLRSPAAARPQEPGYHVESPALDVDGVLRVLERRP